MNTLFLSRRKFLLSSLAGAGTLAVCGLDVRPSLASGNAIAKSSGQADAALASAASSAATKTTVVSAAQAAHFLSESTFAPHVGSVFHLKAGDSPAVPVKLSEIRASSSDSAGAPSHFSLLFQGKPGAALPQETYTLAHPQLGRFPLLLVPVGHNPSAPVLEAVINRL